MIIIPAGWKSYKKEKKEESIKEIVEKYKEIEEINVEMVDALIDYITVGYNAEEKERIINISWNF